MEDPLDARPGLPTVEDRLTAPAVVAQQRREEAPRTTADVVSVAVLGGGFAALAAALAVTSLGGLTGSGALLAAALVLVHAAAVRVEFRAATGSAVPTEPVLVVMLLLLPPALVPVLVLAGLLLGGWRDDAPGALVNRLAVRAGSGWHSLGPVAVLLLAGAPEPAAGLWPDRPGVLLAALVAQVVVDGCVAVVRCLALGAPLEVLARPLAWTFGVDTLLAPVGVCIAVAAGGVAGGLAAVAVVACPVVLLHVLRLDRARHLDEAVTLSIAYDSLVGLALADPLTGLFNRRGWDEAVGEAQRRLDAEPGTVAVVAVGDLDHLKATNDAHGHAVGDGLLRQAAAALQDAAGADGVVARTGGDEFAVLVLRGPDGPPLDAEALVAGLRARLASCERVSGVLVSVSLGAAVCPPTPDLAAAVAAADDGARADKLARAASRDVR